MESEFVLNVRKSAEKEFSAGLYCAESVLLALAGAMGIESELIPKIATAFCSGMSRMCGTCGALSGAIMGIGLALGRSDAGGSVEPSYAATQRLVREFEREFGARDCHLLLGCDLNTPEGQAMFAEKKLCAHCTLFTGTAAAIAARIIEETADPAVQ